MALRCGKADLGEVAQGFLLVHPRARLPAVDQLVAAHRLALLEQRVRHVLEPLAEVNHGVGIGELLGQLLGQFIGRQRQRLGGEVVVERATNLARAELAPGAELERGVRFQRPLDGVLEVDGKGFELQVAGHPACHRLALVHARADDEQFDGRIAVEELVGRRRVRRGIGVVEQLGVGLGVHRYALAQLPVEDDRAVAGAPDNVDRTEGAVDTGEHDALLVVEVDGPELFVQRVEDLQRRRDGLVIELLGDDDLVERQADDIAVVARLALEDHVDRFMSCRAFLGELAGLGRVLFAEQHRARAFDDALGRGPADGGVRARGVVDGRQFLGHSDFSGAFSP